MSFAGLIIELLVAGLLAVTIGYCVILNGRLKKMRADEDTMRSIITELVKSTETAERAILGLRATASECNKTISARLSEAREVAAFLDKGVSNARHDVREQAARNIVQTAPQGQPQYPVAQVPAQVPPVHAPQQSYQTHPAPTQAAQPVMQPPLAVMLEIPLIWLACSASRRLCVTTNCICKSAPCSRLNP